MIELAQRPIQAPDLAKSFDLRKINHIANDPLKSKTEAEETPNIEVVHDIARRFISTREFHEFVRVSRAHIQYSAATEAVDQVTEGERLGAQKEMLAAIQFLEAEKNLAAFRLGYPRVTRKREELGLEGKIPECRLVQVSEAYTRESHTGKNLPPIKEGAFRGFMMRMPNSPNWPHEYSFHIFIPDEGKINRGYFDQLGTLGRINFIEKMIQREQGKTKKTHSILTGRNPKECFIIVVDGIKGNGEYRYEINRDGGPYSYYPIIEDEDQQIQSEEPLPIGPNARGQEKRAFVIPDLDQIIATSLS